MYRDAVLARNNALRIGGNYRPNDLNDNAQTPLGRFVVYTL